MAWQGSGDTAKYRFDFDKSAKVNEVLKIVFGALKEKGYDPISQIVGYLLSGDPTYITSHNNARSVINWVERDEIIEVLVKEYLSKISENNQE